MAQKKHYEQLDFRIMNLSTTDIVCASPVAETFDGMIEDSIWFLG